MSINLQFNINAGGRELWPLLSYRIPIPVTEAFSFTFPWKRIVARKLHWLLFVLYLVICKFIFILHWYCFWCLHKLSDRGSANVAFCISGNFFFFFPLKIGDLQRNHISITMKSTSYELANFGFHVSFVFVFFFLFILLLLCECMPCVLPVFLRSVSVPLDVNVLYEENCVFVQFVVSCDCSSLAGCKCI